MYLWHHWTIREFIIINCISKKIICSFWFMDLCPNSWPSWVYYLKASDCFTVPPTSQIDNVKQLCVCTTGVVLPAQLGQVGSFVFFRMLSLFIYIPFNQSLKTDLALNRIETQKNVSEIEPTDLNTYKDTFAVLLSQTSGEKPKDC